MKNKSLKEQYKNLSFAEISKKIDSKWKNKSTDPIEKKSFEMEMMTLVAEQEKAKTIDTMTKALKEFKCGGKLPTHAYGGLLNGDPTKPAIPQVEDPWNSLNPNLPFIENPFQGMINELPQSALIAPPVPPTLPQRGTKMIPGQMPVLGQHGVNPVSTTQTTVPQVGQIPFRVNVDEFKASTEPRGTGEMSAYTPALLGQGLSTLINAGILAGGYDKVAPVDNPYESQVKNLMASRGIDTTQQRNQILSAYNAAKDNLNNTRSANVRNALDVNMMNVTQDNLAESKLQEQVANQGFKSDYASALGSLGQQKANAQVYAEQATAQNKSTFENNLSYFGDLLAQHGESFSAFKANQNMNTALAQLLNDKYAASGLGISQETVNKFNSGKATKEDWLELTAKIKEVNPNLTIPEFKLQ